MTTQTEAADNPGKQYQVEIVLKDLQFPEGAFWSEQDNCLYFVEWTEDKIWTLRDGRAELFAAVSPGDGPCGLCQDHSGHLWATLYSSGKMVKLDSGGRVLQTITGRNGPAFKGPNQITADSRGGLYFTTSGDFEEDWRTGRPAGAVYYIHPDGETVQLDDGLCFANGITLSHDGQKLIVNEHRKNRILQYDIQADGTISNRRVFAELDGDCLLPDSNRYELGPDGNCCDPQGNIWAAHYGGGKVVGFDPEGRPLTKIHLPRGRRPTNVALTPDSRVLYVTESEAGLLYRAVFER